MTEHREPMTVQEYPEPEIGPHDALLRVEACGICRSDWHIWQGDWSWIGIERQLPAVLGHEFAGVVEAVGSEVRDIRPGMRVLTPFHKACGVCASCRAGASNVCDNPPAGSGGFAELARIPVADFNAIPLPDDVSTLVGSALGCRYMTAYRAVADRGGVRGGEWVAVHGCGGIGLAAVQIAAALGAQVVAIDLDDAKLEQARAEGAVATVNASDHPAAEAVQEITGGGADVSIDALGVKATVLNSLMSLRKRGRHVQVGLTTREEEGMVALPIDQIVLRELEFLGTVGNPHVNYQPLLQMVEHGQLHPERLIGEHVRLEELPRVLESMTSFGTSGFTTIDRF